MHSKPQGFARLSLLAYQHHIIVLLLILALTLFSGFLAKKLTLDADLSALLPTSFKSVQDLAQVKDFFGGIGYVVVTAQNASPESLRSFADDVAQRISPMDGIKFVDHRRPVSFFQDRALYFLDTEDLNTIQKRLKKRWKWEKNKRNPMYVDLENLPAPSLDFDDLTQKYSDDTGKNNWMSGQQSEEAYYFNEDHSLIAIFIKPNIPSSDLGFTQQLLKDIRKQIDTLDLSAYGNNINVEYTGRYQKQVDLQQQMQTDLGITSIVALLLVIGYLFFHFRRIEAVVLILLPLTVGIALTFAFAALVYGSLNILTAFIGVILLGLGIDHGIHLVSRYQDERKRGVNESLVIFNTFTHTGKAITIAALTTLIIFVGLGFSEFRAFHEFGIIAAAGMVFIVLSYLLCMPPLLKLSNQFTWRSSTPIEEKKPAIRFNFFGQRWQTSILVISTLAILVLSANISNVRFNYDFESLGNADLRSFQLDREVNQLLGYSQTPMVALTDNEEEARYVTKQFRHNQVLLEDQTGIDFLLSSHDLVPTDQTEKQRIIKKIGKTIRKVKDSWLDEEDLKKLVELKRMVKSAPFDFGQLPLETRQLFGSDSAEDGVIMLFPAISLSDGERVLQLAKEIRAVQQSNHEHLPIAGESMILADILNLVFEESPKVLLISTLMIFLFMWLFMKKLSYTALCLLPAILTISLTLGTMALLNIELNYINMLMIPILLGIGVDSGIHMVSRAIEGRTLDEVMNEAGMAIFGSITTSGLGIGALLLTNHNGLNSLAYVAIIGLTINLLVSLLLLPTLLNLKPVQRHLQNAGESVDNAPHSTN